MTWGRIASALAIAGLANGGCAHAQPFFHATTLPGLSASHPVPVLQREALVLPLRYRVIVIPGSGCAGMGPIAERYFAGLLHARVTVLHKPGVNLNAWPAPQLCPEDFIQSDSLGDWLQAARTALRADAPSRRANAEVPLVLVGISEGAELLAALAADAPALQGLVLLSGSGLDPLESGELQARRAGQWPAWQRLADVQSSNSPDTLQVQGRSLRYWRGLWQWHQSQALINAPWPLLQVWGDADALIPPVAYQMFEERAQTRNAPWCSWRMVGADHGLQLDDGSDGVQRIWSLLENWARQPAMAGGERLSLCDFRR